MRAQGGGGEISGRCVARLPAGWQAKACPTLECKRGSPSFTRMHKAGALCHLLAGGGGGEFLLGFLLLAGQARLAALGELGDLDFSWRSCRFGDHSRRGRDFAIFFFLLLFGHENPSSLCSRVARGGAAAIMRQLSDSFGLEPYWLAESAGGGSSESGLSGWPEPPVPTGYRRC